MTIKNLTDFIFLHFVKYDFAVFDIPFVLQLCEKGAYIFQCFLVCT